MGCTDLERQSILEEYEELLDGLIGSVFVNEEEEQRLFEDKMLTRGQMLKVRRSYRTRA